MAKSSRILRALLAVLVLAALGLPGVALAQEVDVRLQVNPERVGIEDTFVLTVRVSGAGAGEPRVELGPNFRIVGTAKAHSISFVNGRTTVEIRYQFTVQPLREGIFDVGPAVVSAQGQELRSSTARLQVVGGSVAPPQQRAPADPWARIFGEPRPRPRADTRAQVKMVAALDKEQAYVGEPVTHTLRLYTQQSVKAVEPRSEPQLTGFWTETVAVPDPPQGQKTEFEGQPYTAFLLKKAVLYPTAPGSLTIEPSVWGITMAISDFVFGETSEVTRSTEPLTLKVLPLPEVGKPAGFNGAVGELTLAATLDKTQALVNDALTLKLTLSGTANFKALPPPELPPLSDFRLYDASPQAAPAAKKNAALNARTWEYVLVAKAPGTQVIPGIRYPYFDFAKRQYRVLESQPLTVVVNKGSGEPEAQAGAGTGPEPAGARRSVEPVRHDVAYLKLQAPGLGRGEPPLYRRRWLVASLFLPVLVNLVAGLYLWGRRQKLGDAARLKRRSAHGQARRKLRNAAKAADPRHADVFAAQVSEALLGYLGDRFDQPAAGLTSDRIAELLRGRVDGDQAAALKGLFDRLDYLRFTPAGADGRELKRIHKEAEARLDALERALARSARSRPASRVTA